MVMEIETYELTIDDILALHRSWITDLFVIEGKTEVEIVELLYDRHFVVSVAQIHQCLLEWNLIRHPRPSERNSSLYRESGLFPYSPLLPNSSHITSSQLMTGPQNVEHYISRPLPPIPSCTYSKWRPCAKGVKYPRGKLSDKERLQHTSSIGYEHIDSDINFVSGGTGLFENYVLDGHQRPQMGSDCIPRMMSSRASDTENSTGCTYPPTRKTKKDRNHERVVRK